MKGRIAKTVEEKVSEYRQEKELRRTVFNVRMSDYESVRRDNGESDSDTYSSLPHSLSESLLSLDSSKFDDATMTNDVAAVPTSTSTASILSTTPPQADASASAVSRSEEHSPREKRRFTFNFRERSSKTSSAKSDDVTPTVTSSATTSVTSTPITET